jgi:hypothetical protein
MNRPNSGAMGGLGGVEMWRGGVGRAWRYPAETPPDPCFVPTAAPPECPHHAIYRYADPERL